MRGVRGALGIPGGKAALEANARARSRGGTARPPKGARAVCPAGHPWRRSRPWDTAKYFKLFEVPWTARSANWESETKIHFEVF